MFFFINRVGLYSQWGKIKANLVSESVNTPLQDKLEEMAGLVRKSAFVLNGVKFSHIFLFFMSIFFMSFSIILSSNRLDILVQLPLLVLSLQWLPRFGLDTMASMC